MNRRHFIFKSSLALGAGLTGSSFGAEKSKSSFQLPKLPYPHDALAPHIDARTMEIHHGKHHAGYTRKLNAALKNSAGMDGNSIETLLGKLNQVSDPKLQTALRNNGGGFYNHRLFWEIMAPADKTGKMTAKLEKAVASTFGSVDKFKSAFTAAAKSRFGSGWAWLLVQKGQLKIVSTANQDNPLMKGLVPESQLGSPILAVDVWEHAYYLKYQNQRGAYLDAWWNVVNWDEVSRRFEELTG